MKKQFILLVIIVSTLVAGIIGLIVSKKEPVAGGPMNTVIVDLTEQQVLDKLVVIKAQLEKGETISIDDWKIATRLMTAKTLTDVKGELKVLDTITK